MRLIDADRLLEDKRIEKYYHLKNGDIAIPLIDIKHAPTVEERTETHACDCISRQAAIDALWKIKDERDSVYYTSAIHTAIDAVEQLPSAQPYTDKELQKIQDLEQSQFDKMYDLGYQAGRAAQPEIIRCKDCRYYVSSGWCEGIGTCVSSDDFCSRAERKDE